MLELFFLSLFQEGLFESRRMSKADNEKKWGDRRTVEVWRTPGKGKKRIHFYVFFLIFLAADLHGIAQDVFTFRLKRSW